ncbi:MAG: hypothetical protein NT062_15060 [Proteobacteria bacterium]|nr:hypothetical protein [Pseudomonadota bacterium]
MKPPTLALLVGVALGGCLSVPAPSVPACSTNADCNSGAGEVCEEGVCWGDPPTGMFAATISPPSERDDLVPLELATIALPADGWVGELALEQPVMFTGRVEAYCAVDCGQRLSLDATITITRPSAFHGGPGFRAVVTSEGALDSKSGVSFHVALPRTRPGDLPYTITIVPNNRNTPGPTIGAAELVPPLRTTMAIGDNLAGKNFLLGEGPPPIVSGKIASGSLGLANYRVVALGRWEANAPLAEVSTVSYTGTDGHYAIAIATGLVGNVELVAKPIEIVDGVAKPTLHLGNLAPTSAALNLALPPDLGTSVHADVVVTGNDGTGKIGPIVGARVTVHAQIAGQIGSNVFITTSSEVTTNEAGIASVAMFDGAAFATEYRLRVVPPPGASVVAIFDEPIARAAHIEKQLGDRIAIGGTVVDSGGSPVGGVSVIAHPALRFAWSLDAPGQAFLAEIPTASTVTTKNGEFVVFVDPIVAGAWGSYELEFEQPTSDPGPNGITLSRSSNWHRDDIQVTRDATVTSMRLPPITLPDAAYIHGKLVDFDGFQLEGAELKLFRIEDGGVLCGEVAHAPQNCIIPADLQGRGSSDADGIVRLSLPRQ